MTNTQTYPKDLDSKIMPDHSFSDGSGSATVVQHMQDDAKKLANSAIEGAQHKYMDMKTAASGYLKTIEREVSDKPVQSVAIAFASGVLLSLLMNRR